MRMNTLLSRVRPAISRALSGPNDENLNATQELFILWNASRLGVSVEESRARYAKSRNALPNGHKGHRYRAYNDLSYEIFQVLYGDDAGMVFRSYQFFAPMHFLRMLSYEDPVLTSSHE